MRQQVSRGLTGMEQANTPSCGPLHRARQGAAQRRIITGTTHATARLVKAPSALLGPWPRHAERGAR